jgi:selenocysteine-specific elongation factor
VNTSFFDAELESPFPFEGKSHEVVLHFKGLKIRAVIFPYDTAKKQDASRQFVRLHLSQPVELHWGSRFTLKGWRIPEFQAEGRVLNPFVKKVKPSELRKRSELLERLSGSEKEMLLAKIKEGGIQGLGEGDLTSFCSLSRETLVKLSRELEEESALKILSFSPLHLLAQTSFDYLCDQIMAYLSHFHSNNPGEMGVRVDSVGVRFNLHPRIVSLALKQLIRAGNVNEYGDLIAQAGFRVQLSPEEEALLMELEEMSLKGELHSVSFEELKNRFRLSAKNLNRMLDFLVERKKIVKGKDGYIIHSKWLEELIQRLKNSDRKELTVSEFKAMTGLSRKYAIPLLELLDQMGVTRRRGPDREIL